MRESVHQCPGCNRQMRPVTARTPELAWRCDSCGPMSVWIVVHGEKNEGGDVESVHSTAEGARAAALEVRPHFAGGWREAAPDYWENGCDFVTVEKREVLK